MKRDEHTNEFNLVCVSSHSFHLSFFRCCGMLQESRVSLLRIVEYYNFVREKTEKCEFDIIFGQVKLIEADLTVLLEKFTWINFGMCTLSLSRSCWSMQLNQLQPRIFPTYSLAL